MRSWCVYHIRFEGTREYVGSTVQSLDERIKDHAYRQPINKELTRRLNSAEPFEAKYLHTGLTLKQVSKLEYAEIAKLDNPINLNGVNGLDDQGRKRCCICGKRKSLDEFHNNRHGVAGKMSVCKSCDQKRNYQVVPGEYECSTCGKSKPHTEFHRHKRRKNGLLASCRTCKNAARRKSRKKLNYPVKVGEYTCSGCKQKKPHTEFYRDRRRPNGVHHYCKICSNKNKKKYTSKTRYEIKPGNYECPDCNRTQPHTEFHKNSIRKNGLARKCKTCVVESKPLPVFMVKPGEHKCTKCKQRKKHTEFGRNKRRSGGVKYWCKQCVNEYQNERRHQLNSS